jgi:hypothetical protein
LWSKLSRNLELAEHVHLQGWGEPLLHPSLPEWVRDAHRAGCTVGLTTNGDLLGDAEEWLLRGDVDQVVISLAGDTPQHYTLRDGSCLEEVLTASSRLSRRAKERGLPLRVLGSYLLTRNNAAALPPVVRLTAEAGLSELFVIHLDCRTSRFQFEQSAFAGSSLVEGVVVHLDEAEEVARECGLSYRGPPRQGEQLIKCALDPARFVFVGWDGRVAPCVNLLLPGIESIPRWTEEGPLPVAPVWYGELETATLSDLLDSAVRRRFNASFQARREAEWRFLNTLMAGLDGQPDHLEAADEKRSVALAGHPFPAGCTACPKALGW